VSKKCLSTVFLHKFSSSSCRERPPAILSRRRRGLVQELRLQKFRHRHVSASRGGKSSQSRRSRLASLPALRRLLSFRLVSTLIGLLSRESSRRVRLGTVELFVLNILDQLIFKLKILFNIYICYSTSYLNEEVNCTEPSPSVRLPLLIVLTIDFGEILNYNTVSLALSIIKDNLKNVLFH